MISFSFLTATLEDLSPWMEGGTMWVRCEGVVDFDLRSNQFFDTAARRRQILELTFAHELISPSQERGLESSDLDQQFHWLLVATMRLGTN